MADFDRSAEFRRNLRQLREVSGGALETVPLGGDSLNPQTNTGLLRAKHEADAAAMTLKRYIEQAKIEEKKLAVDTMRARTAGERLRLRMSADTRASLGQQLRADGFGLKGPASRPLGARGLIDLAKGKLNLRAGLKGFTGTDLLITTAPIHIAGAALNTYFDAKEEYDRVKRAEGSENAAKNALVGRAKEGIAQTFAQVSGGKSLWKGVLRGAGFTEAGAEHAIDRAIARTFNESGLRRRELVAANVALNDDSHLLAKWAKLDASSPTTFRLRTKSEAQAYQNERRRVNDLALNAGIVNENRIKFRQGGRDASGN